MTPLIPNPGGVLKRAENTVERVDVLVGEVEETLTTVSGTLTRP